MKITFHFAALHYLNLWLSSECAIHDAISTGNTDRQLNALHKGAAHFRIARNLRREHDIGRGLPRYGPILDIIEPLTGQDFGDDLTGTTIKVCDQISSLYGKRDVRSATTKILWLKVRSPMIIYDSQVRKALRTKKGDLSAFNHAWKAKYESAREHIADACSRLATVLEYTADTSVATTAYVQSLANEEWFKQRVLDIYLWHVGTK